MVTVWLPCEYCGRETPAEAHMSLGVPPCCPDCARVPRFSGIFGVVLMCLMIFLLVREVSCGK